MSAPPLTSNSTVVVSITSTQPPSVDSARQHLTLQRVSKWLAGVATGSEYGTVDIQSASGSGTGSAATLTFASVAAGEVIAVNGVRFIAVSGTPLPANNEFKRGVSDPSDAADFARAVNASSLSTAVLAAAASGVVTLSSQGVGVCQNAISVETLGVVASGTLTPSGVAATDTFVINGVTFTAEKEMARQTATVSTGVAGDTVTVAGVVFTAVASGATGNQFNVGVSDTATCTNLAAAINASTSTSVNLAGAALNSVITAVGSTTTLKLRAVASGTAPNSYTLTATGGWTATGATFSGGIATSNNKFDYGDTDAQTIAEIVRAVGASTSALVNQHVVVTSTATLVTVYAKNPGLPGNTVTLAGTGGVTASVTRLAGGAIAQNWGVQASAAVTCADSMSGTVKITVNGVDCSITAGGTGTTDAASLAAQINGSTNALVRGLVTASVSSSTVTVTAVQGGTSGNAITIAVTGTGLAITGGGSRLASGAVPTHVAIGGTGVTQSTSIAGARLAGGTGIPGSGGANASAYVTR